jgi:hypothetical protein
MAVKCRLPKWLRLRDQFSDAVDPDTIAQSEFFALRAQGYNPITVNEARARIARDGEKANAYKAKVDNVYMFIENIPIWP